jgi:hypothetical protein
MTTVEIGRIRTNHLRQTEEKDKIFNRILSGDMEWSEAVAVSGVWVNAEAAHLRGTARAQRMAFLDTMETRISGWSKQPRKLMWYPDMLQSL